MGIAAYNRGSAVVSAQLDGRRRDADRRADRQAVKALYRRAVEVQGRITACSSLFHEACDAGRWREASGLRTTGRELQGQRLSLCRQIRALGWPASETSIETLSEG